ncbi:tRNA(Ile)-lysidine synthase [Leucobacter luti]|uniref:tRNA lysidine(34) synthetase TilS n=1 Tax=Leucobacter luti TaxID=340320 RepID=UPI0010495676|nr:tRNA lysidine(34) synthetase TilS [Leucobacter luti]MCW2287155.1 tRNA(Ile)-lysidine synthase [Leucobacter luti]TCK41381.1 tRNA(Ile)-lysidine synthase [Leucobacter luti]
MHRDLPLLDTRRAVRRVLRGLEWNGGGEPPLALVALSGGADSLALAAALAYEAPRVGIRAGAVIVDHGLQEGSAAVAAQAADGAIELGLAPVLVRRVFVPTLGGEPGAGPGVSGGGPENAAREARYAALATAATELGASWMLTAHTRSDQAEQVLLGLARGSGTRSVAGIPEERPLTANCTLLRPFLAREPEITRETTVAACALQQLRPWQDPHNSDPAYTRVRVRDRVLPVLEAELGPGVAAALARTADLAAEDAAALDELACAALERLRITADPVTLDIDGLAALPSALRNRVIRRAARADFGAQLGRAHTATVAALVTDWRGQGPAFVPGLTITREAGALVFRVQRGSPRAAL